MEASYEHCGRAASTRSLAAECARFGFDVGAWKLCGAVFLETQSISFHSRRVVRHDLMAAAASAAGAFSAAHCALHVCVTGSVAGAGKAISASDHPTDRLACFRVLRESIFFHALLNLELPRGFARVGRFVNVGRHGSAKAGTDGTSGQVERAIRRRAL